MAKGYDKISGKPTWHKSKYRKRAAATRTRNQRRKAPNVSLSTYMPVTRACSKAISKTITRGIVRALFR